MKTSIRLKRLLHFVQLAALTVATLGLLATGALGQRPEIPEPGPQGPPRDPKLPVGDRFDAKPLALDPTVPTSIRSFQISTAGTRGAESTTDPEVYLIINFSGSPTHYRVGTDPNFFRGDWQPLNVNAPPPRYRLGDRSSPTPRSRYGERVLYLQLKGEFAPPKQAGISLPRTESISEVARDTIIYAPAKTKKYTLSSSEIKSVLQYAKEQGFAFSSSLVSSNSSACDTPAGRLVFNGIEGIDFDAPGLKMLVADGESRTLDGTFFGGKRLNAFWKMVPGDLRLANGDGWDYPGIVTAESSSSISQPPTDNNPNFTLRFKLALKAPPLGCGPSPLILGGSASAAVPQCTCLGARIRLVALSFEGPEDDNWVDANNKWKNAFVR